MKTPEEPSLEETFEALSEYMDVAQKRILALETRVMELREDLIFSKKSNSWISVKERLPEIPDTRFMSDRVLWLTCHEQMGVSRLKRLGSKFRVEWGGAGLLKLDQFTHWMPLPKPPEEEK